jgi:transposase
MRKRYVVRLTDEERRELTDLTKRGKTGARKVRRAHTLLLADEGRTDREIAENLHIGVSTVERTRRRFVEGGPENALNERRRPGKKRLLNGRQEAVLIAEACADPPEGRVRWTMQLLADRIVELGVVESVSDDTIRRILKKTT